jgi:NAD(P)-dependent dehydrogenase (short-subunit alcohol dehydrogenase family)
VASITYHVADVRNPGLVNTVIKEITRRYGRLDLVAHGAGLLEDRLIVDKSVASFERVWSTKVDGALSLAASLLSSTKYFVLFGSIAGVFGNAGQVDYAAANDALDTLAHALSRRNPEMRTVTFDWGPWAASGGGMVSAELEAAYARRKIGAITASEGVDALVRELTWGDRLDSQVVYACADPESLEGDTRVSAPERLSAVGAS